PGAQGPIVYQTRNGRVLEEAVWSLLIEPKPDGEGVRPNPLWQTFNAQSRRLNSSPLCKSRYRRKRAIIPASGFHDWKPLRDRYPEGEGVGSNPLCQTFNLQSRRLPSSPLWKSRYRHKRAIIPASGFHEWKPLGDRKQVMEIHPRNAAIAFAGLYDHWTFEGVDYTAFTMITLPPHPRFSHIHAKSIPLMLQPQDFDLWLDPDFDQVDAFADLMKPHIAQDLEVVPVD